VGRSSIALDEVSGLLQAAGAGDVNALAAFYERTASVVFNLLHGELGESDAAERATVRVYIHVWRTAPAFDPAMISGCAFLMLAVHRETDGRESSDDARREPVMPSRRR
jgi:RNA polymerase sigma-70 factor (ECF subfamily)